MGRITSRIRDYDVNPARLANANPILNTCEYTFTFNDGDETILNANLIAKAMYAQCNPDGTIMFSLTQSLTIDNLTLQLDLLTRK
jgi:hypothetical protein